MPGGWLLTLLTTCACCACCVCVAVQFCRLYRPPEPFPSTVRPSWSMSPSYYHYKGCTCMGGYTASYITK
jgi:hypothetical protein